MASEVKSEAAVNLPPKTVVLHVLSPVRRPVRRPSLAMNETPPRTTRLAPRTFGTAAALIYLAYLVAFQTDDGAGWWAAGFGTGMVGLWAVLLLHDRLTA